MFIDDTTRTQRKAQFREMYSIPGLADAIRDYIALPDWLTERLENPGPLNEDELQMLTKTFTDLQNAWAERYPDAEMIPIIREAIGRVLLDERLSWLFHSLKRNMEDDKALIKLYFDFVLAAVSRLSAPEVGDDPEVVRATLNSLLEGLGIIGRN